jgi:hypothetical protein
LSYVRLYAQEEILMAEGGYHYDILSGDRDIFDPNKEAHCSAVRVVVPPYAKFESVAREVFEASGIDNTYRANVRVILGRTLVGQRTCGYRYSRALVAALIEAVGGHRGPEYREFLRAFADLTNALVGSRASTVWAEDAGKWLGKLIGAAEQGGLRRFRTVCAEAERLSVHRAALWAEADVSERRVAKRVMRALGIGSLIALAVALVLVTVAYAVGQYKERARKARAAVAIAFSPNGAVLAIARSGGVEFLDVVHRKQAGPRLVAGYSMTWNLTFSPDGTVLASGGLDRALRLWDVVKGKGIGSPLTGHTGAISTIAFSPDGTLVASGDEDHWIRLWDVVARRQVAVIDASDEVQSVAFSPNGKLLATGGFDKSVRFWDVTTRREVGTALMHDDRVRKVAFSPDGKTIATTADDMTVRLWDVSTHRQLGAPIVEAKTWVSDVAFSPDGSEIASAAGGVTLWNIATRTQLGTGFDRSCADRLAFSPDGTMLATKCGGGTVQLWNVASEKVIGPPL